MVLCSVEAGGGRHWEGNEGSVESRLKTGWLASEWIGTRVALDSVHVRRLAGSPLQPSVRGA